MKIDRLARHRGDIQEAREILRNLERDFDELTVDERREMRDAAVTILRIVKQQVTGVLEA